MDGGSKDVPFEQGAGRGSRQQRLGSLLALAALNEILGRVPAAACHRALREAMFDGAMVAQTAWNESIYEGPPPGPGDGWNPSDHRWNPPSAFPRAEFSRTCETGRPNNE